MKYENIVNKIVDALSVRQTRELIYAIRDDFDVFAEELCEQYTLKKEREIERQVQAWKKADEQIQEINRNSPPAHIELREYALKELRGGQWRDEKERLLLGLLALDVPLEAIIMASEPPAKQEEDNTNA